MPSPFDNPQVFRQILVHFKTLSPCAGIDLDERGNLQSQKEHITAVRFKLNKPTSREDLEMYGATSTQRIEAYCLEPLILPIGINTGHSGISELSSRHIEVQLLEILEGGISPILNNILGQKVILELSLRSLYGSGA